MDLPFNYIVLGIFNELNNRNMPLKISRITLINYLTEFIKESFFTASEKKEIADNFDFQYAMDEFMNKYYDYFDYDGDDIVFDEEYSDELNGMILEEIANDDMSLDVQSVVSDNVRFLEIIGVKFKKDVYDYLLSIFEEIEDCYKEMRDLEKYIELNDVNAKKLINRIKIFNMKKVIMLYNTSTLLSDMEYKDLAIYSSFVSENNLETDIDDVELLIDDEKFDKYDLVHDIFERSLFTTGDLHIACLNEKLMGYKFKQSDDVIHNTVKFYLTFLDLLEEEIKRSSGEIQIDLVEIKYNLMYVLDTVYDMNTLANRNNYYACDKENYYFIENDIYFFIKELLMYDDSKYYSDDYESYSLITYVDNTIKKLLIETYYKLTSDGKIIDVIKNNELYGINKISSSLLEEIISKPKKRIKE